MEQANYLSGGALDACVESIIDAGIRFREDGCSTALCSSSNIQCLVGGFSIDDNLLFIFIILSTKTVYCTLNRLLAIVNGCYNRYFLVLRVDYNCSPGNIPRVWVSCGAIYYLSDFSLQVLVQPQCFGRLRFVPGIGLSYSVLQ